MKKLILIFRIFFFAFIVLLSNNAIGQNCVCALCNVSCNSAASAHTNPQCPIYKNNMANPGSTKVSSSVKMEQEIMGSIFKSIVNSAISYLNSNPAERKKFEEHERKILAIKQAILKRYNDSIAQTRYDEMMKDYKKLEGSGDLAYKGLDNNKKWGTSVKFNCKITSFKGDIRIVKSDGTIRKFSEDQSLVLSPGDWIYTNKDSWLKLHYDFEFEGKDIIIGQNSFVNLVNNEEGAQNPKLVKGNMYVTKSIVNDASAKTQEELISIKNELKSQQNKWKRKFEIRTPCAALAIRGTTFSVSQDSLIGTTLIVTEGLVDLTGLLMGQKITIEAGYKGIVNTSGEIRGPIRVEGSEIEKWWENE